MNSKDPYADHRDSKGRFKKGHPGGPGRPQEWVDATEIVKQRNILIKGPPTCYCGQRSYRFKLEKTALFARCNNCDDIYVYDGKQEQWRRFRFFG